MPRVAQGKFGEVQERGAPTNIQTERSTAKAEASQAPEFLGAVGKAAEKVGNAKLAHELQKQSWERYQNALKLKAAERTRNKSIVQKRVREYSMFLHEDTRAKENMNIQEGSDIYESSSKQATDKEKEYAKGLSPEQTVMYNSSIVVPRNSYHNDIIGIESANVEKVRANEDLQTANFHANEAVTRWSDPDAVRTHIRAAGRYTSSSMGKAADPKVRRAMSVENMGGVAEKVIRRTMEEGDTNLAIKYTREFGKVLGSDKATQLMGDIRERKKEINMLRKGVKMDAMTPEQRAETIKRSNDKEESNYLRRRDKTITAQEKRQREERYKVRFNNHADMIAKDPAAYRKKYDLKGDKWLKLFKTPEADYLRGKLTIGEDTEFDKFTDSVFQEKWLAMSRQQRAGYDLQKELKVTGTPMEKAYFSKVLQEKYDSRIPISAMGDVKTYFTKYVHDKDAEPAMNAHRLDLFESLYRQRTAEEINQNPAKVMREIKNTIDMQVEAGGIRGFFGGTDKYSEATFDEDKGRRKERIGKESSKGLKWTEPRNPTPGEKPESLEDVDAVWVDRQYNNGNLILGWMYKTTNGERVIIQPNGVKLYQSDINKLIGVK